ncbi:hypothetical protein ALC56_10016 [Trachymyrmex septentrionalis]|uniref:Uncharacterized protein n=1 Tax=Trachymyrmex septentrionalis TaxID=34720 RepID=A0A195F5W2_9HYME|nr:hypothetical protein ALC56_10016 [Trachymyrmex septentrionalis]
MEKPFSQRISPRFTLGWKCFLVVRRIRLLTVGGTPLDAMQRYGPIWRRVIRVISSSGPTILPAATVYICRCEHTNSYGHYDALLYTLRSSFNSTLSIAFEHVSRNLCVTTSAYFDNNLKSSFVHAPVEGFEVNSYFKLLSKRRTLFSTIIGSQTECTDFDCENRKTDSAFPNTPFYGTYRLMESRLNLSARSM